MIANFKVPFYFKKRLKSTLKISTGTVGVVCWGQSFSFTSKISLVVFSFLFFFVSGLDFIGVEGSNYPRKFETAPGMIHPGA